jgi:putative DNA primase/helicase
MKRRSVDQYGRTLTRQRITDDLTAEIHTHMRTRGYENMRAIDEAIIAHARQHRYHPIHDYLNGLKWDGQDHIGAMLNHLIIDTLDQVENGSVNVPSLIRRWFIGAVAHVLAQKQLPMLVLAGPQNIGKSTWVRWLASPLPGYFFDGPIKPDAKDSLFRLYENWIWEVAELGSTTSRANVEALKAVITMDTLKERRAYGRYDTVGQACACLIGTVNDSGAGFLNDVTGTRRFVVIPLWAISPEYRERIDINQL